MMSPYGRIVIQQIVVIFDAFLLIIFNTTSVFLILLIILKLIVDIQMHIKSHKKLETEKFTNIEPEKN